ncbi:centriolar protein SAS [Chloropicon roscoffensis]|uniref:Centriolar protein SAS n=1 Tax=Chloropicon roscoffensis TaxID=1461544 RepID=A0AAX4NXS0_9CHLO
MQRAYERGMDDLMDAVENLQPEDVDPSLVDGYYVFYEREVPFELRVSEAADMPQEVGALEAIRVKILLKGEQQQPDALRVELTSETNLFFHYVHELTEASFHDLQEGQKLMVEFAEYSSVLLRMLNNCIKEPHTHLAVFIMHDSGEARLDFIQNMEYKFVELLSCKFANSSEEEVRSQITYRYNVVKSRLALMQARLADVNALVKIKNPSLLLQLQRTPARSPYEGKRILG